MILEILKMGNPLLRQVAAPYSPKEILSPKVQALVEDMLETMRAESGVGLAAPQVGVSRQLTVIESGDPEEGAGLVIPTTVLFNPVFTWMGEEQVEGWEGCLSVDNLRGKVWRSRAVRLEALDRKAKPVKIPAEGFLAVVLQHECDHLIGKLFLDRMRDLGSLTQPAEYRQFWGGAKAVEA